jgi:hypothetical protein
MLNLGQRIFGQLQQIGQYGALRKGLSVMWHDESPAGGVGVE